MSAPRSLVCIWAIATNTVRESVRSKLLYGLLFFAVAGLILAPALHRVLHRFHLEDEAGQR